MADNAPPAHYAPGSHPDLPPPVRTTGVVAWAHQNLFSSPLNIILTLAGFWLLYSIIPPLVEWAFVKSVWTAASRTECWDKMEVAEEAACWAFVKRRFLFFVYGFYPEAERWRVNLSFVLLILAILPVLYDRLPGRRHWFWYVAAFPFLVGWLLVGGFGLTPVGTDDFGGFMLTLVIGVTGISFSLPIGIALALGRTSDMPVLRMLCVLFIEFIRGVPLIALLFVASTMLNYFLPPGTTFDLLMRVLIMVTLFSSAYIGGGGAGRTAGDPEGTGGGGGLARPLLLEGAALDHLAAGSEDLDSRHRQHLHRPVQGHHPGADHRPAGPARHRPLVAGRLRLGRARAGDVPVHRGLLLPVLFRDVALLALSRTQARHRIRTIEVGPDPQVA